MNSSNDVLSLKIYQRLNASNPFDNYGECNDIIKPMTYGYHVHALFDGNNRDSIKHAYIIYQKYITFLDGNVELCQFPHSQPNGNQLNVCLFEMPFQFEQFPLPGNIVFNTTNYAFFIPNMLMNQSMEFWKINNNDKYVSWIFHEVTGCQINDHSKWINTNYGFFESHGISLHNLLCCHNGPPMCTCNIVQYQITDGLCLTVNKEYMDGIRNDASLFVLKKCEDARKGERNLGSWREIIYNEKKNWFQIENYGDRIEPIYMCIGIKSDNYNENVGVICEENLKVELLNCGELKNVVSKRTRFMVKVKDNGYKIQFKGCNSNDDDWCLNFVYNVDLLYVEAVLTKCENTKYLKRHFFV